MAKRSQQDSGEERVTAKSRPMMNLTARMPSVVSSSTSSSPGKRHYGSQDPWRSIEGEDRSGDPIKAQIYLEPPINTTMSSSWKAFLQQVIQNWMTTVLILLKSGELKLRRTTDRGDLMKLLGEWYEKFDLVTRKFFSRNGVSLRDTSGRPDNINSQEVARPQNFVMGNDETELELSVDSGSFVNRVNDQVRKRQKRISNVTGDEEEHSMIWGMFMAVTMESATFMGKNFQNNRNSIVNTTDLTLKQMFDISAKLVSQQEEITGLETIGGENHSWKYMSLIGDERIINLQRTKVYVFSDSVLCLGKIHENPESNEACKKRIGWITTSQSYRDFDGIDGEPMEIRVEHFPRIGYVAALQQSQKFTEQIRRDTRKFHRKNSIYVDVQRHFLWNKRQ